MVKCWKCGREYGEWRDQCPECGAQYLKKKKALKPYFAVIGIIAVVVILYMAAIPPPCPTCSPTCSPTISPTISPTPCTTCQQCKVQTLPINAVPRPGDIIEFTVLGGGDLALTKSLEVRINGEPAGSLPPVAGSSTRITFSGSPRMVIVVANSTCGVETVVLQKNL